MKSGHYVSTIRAYGKKRDARADDLPVAILAGRHYRGIKGRITKPDKQNANLFDGRVLSAWHIS
jgi:hypothetical protein